LISNFLLFRSRGFLRPIGVTSSARVGILPDVPTIGEFLPGYEATAWTGIGTPANTSPEIVATLNQHVNAALADATFKAKLAELGLEPFAERSGTGLFGTASASSSYCPIAI
jgi:tripartite-type tricarboxylate transporter receptor subunit TctC